MCGICGFIHRKKVKKKLLEEMSECISYRGPDDKGYYLSEFADSWQVGLAHRRLSILDLSAAGHQPMKSDDGKIVVCFNGEIYNFREIRRQLKQSGMTFHSDCDTEVILCAYEKWGIACVDQFNGMFAIAVYDGERGELFLIRDRMGVKPLYYYEKNGEIVFASELKPIMRYPYLQKNINMAGLCLYLGNDYITAPYTIFEDIYKLEPGNYLKWSHGKCELHSYWSISDVMWKKNRFEGSYKEAKKELGNLLLDSVSKRMISDVPIGAFLSGGYDSALVTALMREVSDQPVRTFTIGFDEEKYDESGYAQTISEKLGTKHTCEYLSMSEARQYIDEFPVYFDEPMCDPSGLAMMLLSKITKKHVTVALSGDAGDELFCGYDSYEWINRVLKFQPYGKIARIINKFIPIGGIDHRIARLIHMDSEEHIITSRYYGYWESNKKLLPYEFPLLDKTHAIMRLSTDYQEKWMLSDMVTYLPDDILTKVDRSTMAFSLESRAPLLDYRVVEFALSLPLEYKYQNGVRKRILKDLVYQYIPRQMMERPKHGFGVPVYQWLHDDFSAFAKGYLEKDYIRGQGIFNYEMICSMIKGFHSKRKAFYDRNMWNLIVFQMWWDRYMR